MADDPLLIVDDDPFMRELLADHLSSQGYEIAAVETGAQAREEIEKQSFHLALLDLSLPDVDGMSLVDLLSESSPETVVILMTGYPSLGTAIEGLRRGAQDYLVKPIKMPEVLAAIDRAKTQRQLQAEVQALRDRIRDLESENTRLRQAEAEHQARPQRSPPASRAYGIRPPAQPAPGASGEAQ